MKKKKRIKRLIIIAVIAGVFFTTMQLGVFVYPYSLSSLKEVPRYDLLDDQFDIEQKILADYQQDKYTVDSPYIILDPYRLNPLSALIIFDISKSGDAEVVIQGDDAYSTYKYTHKISAPRAEVPILGLYAGRENTVTLNIDNEKYEYKISTEPLPLDMQEYILVESKPEKMAPGVTLCVAIVESYSTLLDNNAQVRGYLSNKAIAHGTSVITLKNGNVLSVGEEYLQVPYHMAHLYEYNWLGKIFKIYQVPNGVHHSIEELPNGDILASSNPLNMASAGTREDTVIVVDRNTGAVKKTYDYKEILDMSRDPHHHFKPEILNAPNIDWLHMNAAIHDEKHNSIIISGAAHSAVVSIDADTSEINWILGPHDEYNDELQQYLLTPIGDDFEWQWCQHDPEILETGDPNFVDILLFDNGQNKSFYQETSVPAKDNYSRAVIFRIDQKNRTVEQLWQYGKERGSELYSTYLGSAKKYDDNILIDFGGQLRIGGEPVDDIVQTILDGLVTNSTVVEVTDKGEVVYEVSVHENDFTNSAGTYQASRIPLFTGESFKTMLGEVKGEKIGNSYICGLPTIEFPKIPFYFGKLSADFNVAHVDSDDRLIMSGILYNDGEIYLISKAFIELRSKNDYYIFDAGGGINGRFFLSLDLDELNSGEYQIAVFAATVDGIDVEGKRQYGHFKTEYKITVE